MKLFLILCLTLSISSCLLKKDSAQAPANNETTDTSSDQPPVDTVDHTDTVNTDPQFKPQSP